MRPLREHKPMMKRNPHDDAKTAEGASAHGTSRYVPTRVDGCQNEEACNPGEDPMSVVHEGGCACGAVRYRVEGEPEICQICHCRFCQRRLGSAFAAIAYFDERNVAILQGELREFEHFSDETGRWLRMQFCVRCGTTVTHAAQARPGLKAIAIATLDDPEWPRVQRHIWVASKRSWIQIPEQMTTLPRGAVVSPEPASSSAS
jgi:hypothetical protein